MSRVSLQEWLLADRSFALAHDALEAEAVRSQFPGLQSFRSDLDPSPDWPYLLFCASILAPSVIPVAEERALRIAQSALTDESCMAAERDAALIILDTLSNRRAIELAEERDKAREGITGRLGAAQAIDWVRRSFENRIDLADGTALFANRFQRRFWAAAAQTSWLSVSAPTSAGKSFILAQWLAQQLLLRRFSRIVYLAPTRALVQQVENDLRVFIATAGCGEVAIRSIPTRGAQASAQEVFVFTQERLHYHIQLFGPEGIDAIVVDEAHKVGDSHRGILLQDVVEQVAAANPKASVIFTSPLTDNPEALLTDAPADARKTPLRSDDATVNQNLLWLEPDPEDPKVWRLLLRRGEGGLLLGTFDAGVRMASIKARLARLAILSDTGEGGILIYADGAARAEEIAQALAQALPELPQSRQVRALDELCDATIHKDYRLRKVLSKGVAFHYGNMPLLLRTAIEDLFRDGHIRFLVCTSTLVEGVNLPCRSILLHAPRKGKSERMQPPDFWNLAGRAGRWGKEFQGNVICVDTQDAEAWGETLPKSRSKYRIERTTDRLISEPGRLLAFIRAGSPSDRANSDQDLETAVSYLAATRAKYGSLLQAPWRSRVPARHLAELDETLVDALADIQLPDAWIRRHAGISPFAMHRMAAALLPLKDRMGQLLPVEPDQDDAARQYGRIFEMMGHYMTTAFGQGGRCFALGILTTNWMMGYPIKRIIAERISWNKKHKSTQKVPAAIRKALEDIEQIARFQAPRYLACYSDIARVVLEQQGQPEKAVTIPDLTLSLEFGVRGPVQLELMALGLSRSSTLAVAGPVAKELLKLMVTGDPGVGAELGTLSLVRAPGMPALVATAFRKVRASELEARS